jgi:chemotaxis protein CheD
VIDASIASPGALRPARSRTSLAADAQVVFLHPGQMFAAAHRCEITTVLGSCVSVCLYDTASGVGGANHYLLPRAAMDAIDALRCGPSAIRALIECVVSLGARRERLAAKVYGGAHVLRAISGERWHLGAANVEVARAVLTAERIPLRAMDVGGLRGRKLQFITGDGTSRVKEL